jgi:hypothetical protein
LVLTSKRPPIVAISTANTSNTATLGSAQALQILMKII